MKMMKIVLLSIAAVFVTTLVVLGGLTFAITQESVKSTTVQVAETPALPPMGPRMLIR